LAHEDDGTATLRRWIVAVVLGLLVVGFLVEIIDAWFFGDRFHMDAGFYGLVGGVIVGVFGAKAVSVIRHRDGP
jgi:uncharacterized membrane protein